MKTIKSKINLLLIPIAAVLFMLYSMGCNEDNVTPSQQDNVEFSSVGSTDSVGDNIGVLVLSEVKILIKDIKLNVSSTSEDSVNFKVGPYVLFLNFASNTTVVSSAYIPPGRYDKVRFMVHKLGDNETPPDPEFVDGNGRYSVIVKGTFGGVAFTYKSDKSAHQKLTFPNHLVVNTSGKSNVTLMVKPYIWFIKNGIYLNPLDINNRNDIDNNIKTNINNNFKIFVDDDKNGQPD